MKSRRSTPGIPACVFAGVLLAQRALADPLPNAWQINDNLTTAGVIQYQTNLTVAQVSAASSNGWRYDLVTRMISDSGSAAAHSMAFGDGTRRFYIFFDLNASGQLTAQLLGNASYTLTSASDATNYHSHRMTYDPITSNATYRVDGALIASWPGEISVGQSNQVMWGANASSGRGVMNYHHAEFEVTGQGVIASYHAGFAGNPGVAPSPTNQAWTRFTSGGAAIESAVSPDAVAMPPLVTTLAASNVQPTSATLHALLNPDGLAASLYFEYGTTTNYGSFTATNTVSASVFTTNVSSAINNLSPLTTYHFRAVISNSFGVVTGSNLSFSTIAFVTTLPATGVTLTSATLSASLNPGGLDAAYYWEYGTATNYGTFSVTNNIPGGGSPVTVSNAISGLSAATTYHFRAVASNSAGSFTGTNLSFTTASVYSIGAGVQNSSVAWGDYDNDGWLDILLAGDSDGTPVTQVWRNTGSGFTNINAGLPAIGTSSSRPSVSWGDYDNDGRLDILLTGNGSGGGISQIWRNTGNGFTNINAGLSGVYDSSGAWGDYDNDGRLDLVLTGTSNALSGSSQVWRNTGNGFVHINAGLSGVFWSSVAWGDYDNDGRLDLALSGFDGAVVISQVWRNTGTGFTNLNAGLPGVHDSSIAWGDYDNDGRLDILLTGVSITDNISQIWRNTGTGFTNINAGLPGVAFGSGAWGDYDNDGLQDVLLTGGGISQIWRNTGNGFTNLNAGLPGMSGSSAAWGDANNDGRLDILLAGSGITQARLNLQPSTNTPPAAPSEPGATINFPVVSLAWDAASDSQTPAAGLTYNLRVGTVPGGSDVVGPEAGASGLRRVPAMGNTQTGTNAALVLTTGAYYWSVQAVDSAFAGSAFATEGNFSVPALPIAITFPATDLQLKSAVLNASVNPNTLATTCHFEYGLTTNYGNFTATNSLPGGVSAVAVSETISGLNLGVTYHFRVVASNATGMVSGGDQFFATSPILTNGLPQFSSMAPAWGDCDRDGRLDLLLAGQTAGYVADIWRNTGNGFSNINVGLDSGYGNAVAWADYDNDGDLDVLQAGQNPSSFGGPAFIKLWRNTGNSFTRMNTSITPLGSGSLAWGDFDNDGRKDLLITGHPDDSGAPASQIWRNTGSGFANLNAGLPGVWSGSVAWADFDNDNRLDLILTGAENSGLTGGISQIWRNTGAAFTNIMAGLPGIFHGSAAWGDYDNDGRLDLLLAGTTNGNSTGAVAQVWRNTGSGFTNINAGLPGVYLGSVAWGDYDNDGSPDILWSGTTNGVDSGALSQVWRNTGNGFTNLNLGLPGVLGGASDFADYDRDGRLDIFLAGTTAASQPLSGVWINHEPATNTPAAAPSALVSSLLNGQVHLSWNPATDAETPAAGLSYNLRVGTAPGAGNVVGPEAENDGFGLRPALGNAQLGTNAFLNLEPGTYYWSVQAVDSAFAGGPFATEASLVVPPPILSILSAGANAVISWQPAYAGWMLQESLSLAPVAWSNSPSGATNPAFVPASSQARFYRLFKP